MVKSWSLTQEMTGSSPFTVMNSANSVKTFRENSINTISDLSFSRKTLELFPFELLRTLVKFKVQNLKGIGFETTWLQVR